MEYEYSTSGSLDPVTTTILVIFYLIAIVVAIVTLWKIFTKAGEPGWASIVPFYNAYTEFKIAGLNPWLFLLMFIPVANIVVAIIVALKLGERFGKGAAWSILLLLIFPIGYLILAFGTSVYTPPPGVGGAHSAGYAPAGYNPNQPPASQPPTTGYTPPPPPPPAQ